MKRQLICITLIITFYFINCHTVPPQVSTQNQIITNQAGYQYLLFLPADYGEKSQPWPLILFLHGAGERGFDLESVKTHGPPKIALERKDFPFIVVSPQCPARTRWSNELLLELLDNIIEKYDVDTERIYLTGLSMGGFGTWSLACEYPDRFAALAPICGSGDPKQAAKLKNIPVWAFHGDNDQVVPYARSQEMINALKRAGNTNARLTTYPGVGHNAWTQTYAHPELYQWLLKQKKISREN